MNRYIFLCFLLISTVIDIGLCIVTFNNENNMYSCINGSGYSTSTLISLGKMNTLTQCENAFLNYTNARSFIYYPSTYGGDDYRYYCYIRTDTWWNPTQEDNVISGQIDNFNQCKNNYDCELNGKCVNNYCECKPAWTGIFCQYLNFKNGSKDLGYQRKDYSQWGASSIYNQDTKQWNTFSVEMVNNCGISTCCGPNSHIVKAVSDGDKPGGPYTYDSVVVPYFAHEPMIVYSKYDDLNLLYHWGNGDKSEELITGCKDGYTNGPPPSNNPSNNNINPSTNLDGPNSMTTFISYSKSLDGPWQKIELPGDPYLNKTDPKLGGTDELCLSNPYIYDNGSILMAWTQRLSWDIGSEISLVFSDGWNKTYKFDTNELWVTELYDASSMEDPFLWRDETDNTFHLLMHGMIETDNPHGNPWLRAAQGRHAFSIDGWNWNLSPHYTYNTTICYDDGDCINYGRRERPHLIFDINSGEPLYLTNGIQQNNLNYYDKTFNGAVPLYTSQDYCEMGKKQYCK